MTCNNLSRLSVIDNFRLELRRGRLTFRHHLQDPNQEVLIHLIVIIVCQNIFPLYYSFHKSYSQVQKRQN